MVVVVVLQVMSGCVHMRVEAGRRVGVGVLEPCVQCGEV